jgi:signal transduction histidine kinase/ActR/RegA family two-component response regulator
MSLTPPSSGSSPQGFAASARADGAGRALRRRDDGDAALDLQSLLDRVPGVVARVHRSAQGHWSVPFASSDFARLCGIGLPALREDARLLSARIHAEDLARLHAVWTLHGESLRSLEQRIRVRRPDGQWSVFDASATLEPAADGGLQWNCEFVDIAHEAALDDEVRHRLALWQSATEAADIGVLDIHLASGSLRLDAVACRLHGLDASPVPLSLESWLDSVAAADRPTARAMLVAPAAPGERMRQTLAFSAAGSPGVRTLEFILRSSPDAQRLIGTCVDVTRQSNAAAPRRDVSDTDKIPGDQPSFLSRVSHELRTPLNGILGFAQLMALDQAHPLAPAQSQRLEIVRHSGARLLSLIDQLLGVSRIEPGRLRLRGRPIDLRLLIERCAVDIMPLAQQRGIDLRVEIPLTAPAVRADPEALEQVVASLLSNAIKYNRPRGRVRIRFEAADHTGVLIVDDTGTGMSAAQLEKLFGSPHRFGADSADTAGSGLGLVVARKLVRAMGGEIEALSQVARGSRFTVSLPLAKSDVLRVAQSAAAPDMPSLWDAAAQPVVMYVEHDDVNAALMRQIFGTQPNWRLLSAGSGPEALQLARQHELSLILLDLNLPGMSGFEVRERLKSDPHTREVRCIAFSADVSPQQIEHALARGFDDYWTKPADVAVLVAKLKCEFRALAASPDSNSGSFRR